MNHKTEIDIYALSFKTHYSSTCGENAGVFARGIWKTSSEENVRIGTLLAEITSISLAGMLNLLHLEWAPKNVFHPLLI